MARNRYDITTSLDEGHLITRGSQFVSVPDGTPYQE